MQNMHEFEVVFALLEQIKEFILNWWLIRDNPGLQIGCKVDSHMTVDSLYFIVSWWLVNFQFNSTRFHLTILSILILLLFLLFWSRFNCQIEDFLFGLYLTMFLNLPIFFKDFCTVAVVFWGWMIAVLSTFLWEFPWQFF